jgi:hypothetical protein
VYQWRGSDVSNIVTFASRYPGVATFEITTHRRSRPAIIDAANAFAATIPGRLPKTMGHHRPSSGGAEVVAWTADDEQREAGWVTNLVLDVHDAGVPYRSIAVLVRGRAAYRRLVEEFATFDVPVQPGGRSGLFDQPEASVLGRTFAWMTGVEWRPVRGPGALVSEDALLDEYQSVFDLDGAARNRVRRYLREWRDAVPGKTRSADLVGELYELLAELGVRYWDLVDPLAVNRLGTLARFTALLADYESVRRRARPDAEAAGEQVGGQDRGDWYYRNLAIHIVNYAQGAYEGFDGEPDFELDAVDLTTVHRAKGLEWPAVFVPSMTANRFPTTRTGQVQNWQSKKPDQAEWARRTEAAAWSAAQEANAEPAAWSAAQEANAEPAAWSAAQEANAERSACLVRSSRCCAATSLSAAMRGSGNNATESHANRCAVPESGVTLPPSRARRRRFHPGEKHCAGPRSRGGGKVDVRVEQGAVPRAEKADVVVRGLPVSGAVKDVCPGQAGCRCPGAVQRRRASGVRRRLTVTSRSVVPLKGRVDRRDQRGDRNGPPRNASTSCEERSARAASAARRCEARPARELAEELTGLINANPALRFEPVLREDRWSTIIERAQRAEQQQTAELRAQLDEAIAKVADNAAIMDDAASAIDAQTERRDALRAELDARATTPTAADGDTPEDGMLNSRHGWEGRVHIGVGVLTERNPR